MNWFKDTFIKSIDDKITRGGKSYTWISEKQVYVCLKYMTPHSVHDSYWIVVGDYQYTLQVYKDYGKITKCDKRIATR